MGSRARAGEYVPARVDRTRRAERVADLRLDDVPLDDSSRERRRWRSLYWKSTVAWGSFLRLHGRILIDEQYTTENTPFQACDRLVNGSRIHVDGASGTVDLDGLRIHRAESDSPDSPEERESDLVQEPSSVMEHSQVICRGLPRLLLAETPGDATQCSFELLQSPDLGPRRWLKKGDEKLQRRIPEWGRPGLFRASSIGKVFWKPWECRDANGTSTALPDAWFGRMSPLHFSCSILARVCQTLGFCGIWMPSLRFQVGWLEVVVLKGKRRRKG
ncbi:hypothetical protein QBC34DRAFT_47099 [Podospora aff. communis PSN243]|uniref:FHA domain-containing protein n=1 Tax=Podospora aff. communis PSN243 TaxID=3040156 RepID=A0AAV9GSU6_9PEZI|nr:hypothetical protein QBC34DRAFT_47099 [Podospora aff. communis PSN243]